MARVVFFGSPEFAVPSLRGLAASAFRPSLVVTQPDRPSGRGRKATPTRINSEAAALNIPVRTVSGLKDPEVVSMLQEQAADVFVVAAFGLIFPRRILDMPRAGCVNVHASLLPAWRGASPVNMALVNGDRFTGVSIMRMVRGVDAGPVFAQQVVPVDPMEDAGGLSGRLSHAGARLLLETLPGITDGSLDPVEQPSEGISHAGMLSKADGLIPWERDVFGVHDHIRGMNPWPGSFTWHGGTYIKVLKARPCASISRAARPGEVLSCGARGMLVACGTGTILIETLQVQGRKVLCADDFLRGYCLEPGELLGEKQDDRED